ncbi:envelope-like protein, partial [Trifolium medium]|nr:envelope-like protein [Trifolium medium]
MLGQSGLNTIGNVDIVVATANVVSSDVLHSSTKNIVDDVLSFLKKKNPKPNIVPDVDTSLAQPGQNVEIVPGTTDEESEYESASEQEKSQDKLVTEHEEGKSDDAAVNSQADESNKTMSVDEEESVSPDKNVETEKDVVNVDDLDFVDMPLEQTFGLGIAKRLRNRTGKAVSSTSKTHVTTKKKVFVRGRCVEFSPAVINRFLGRSEEAKAEVEVSNNIVCKTITGNQVKQWPRKGKLSSSRLTMKYDVLNRIGVANWVPTHHTSDIATVVKMPIAFPTLLCSIILDQHPGILISTDVACKRESPLTLHYRLFEGTHVQDNIVATSGKKTSGSMTRKEMIADLKDTCKALDEKKFKLERLIQALELEDAAMGVKKKGGGEEETAAGDDQEEDT